MELNWTVRGACANWKLTITAEPPDPEEDIEFRDEWQTEPFSHVSAHFRDVVILVEAARQLEDVTGEPLSYA
jgi:hypothetical protein